MYSEYKSLCTKKRQIHVQEMSPHAHCYQWSIKMLKTNVIILLYIYALWLLLTCSWEYFSIYQLYMSAFRQVNLPVHCAYRYTVCMEYGYNALPHFADMKIKLFNHINFSSKMLSSEITRCWNPQKYVPTAEI